MSNEEEIDLDGLQDQQPTMNDRRTSINDRLYKLKLKINQSKQLNLKETTAEGERLGSEEGILQYTKAAQRQEKDRKIRERQHIHAKLIHVNVTREDDDMNALTQTAAESIHKAHYKAEKDATARFSAQDYHNPEGQFRNYDKHVRSIHYKNETMTANITKPSNSYHITEQEAAVAYQKERQGASRLASALQQRAEKTLKKRKKTVKDMVANDVGHINKRNMLYNQKIARNFDSHTAEIRQNLERGTAL